MNQLDNGEEESLSIQDGLCGDWLDIVIIWSRGLVQLYEKIGYVP